MKREFIYIRAEVSVNENKASKRLAEKLTEGSMPFSSGDISFSHVRFFCDSKDEAWTLGHSLMSPRKSGTVMNDQLIEL